MVALALPKSERILSHCSASRSADVECMVVFTAFPFQLIKTD
ncbi:hypothetical protein EM595_p1035 (plasmid) [Duffyella gerundensis]|uniref:Uncharacterized protein n=1 Tax=Duffyella gerundensis TaxID=1619313 RepID=A0A0U5L652_9GAMM|nr:hypothetical protein EM595_p1035 [Duffyella gerundensis]